LTITIDGGEPFFYRGSSTGCLLVHGFTGAPNEMRGLGKHLAACGYSVLGVRLFGHGTRIEDLLRAREQDWIASVEDGFAMLQSVCSRVVVIGLSMGAVLALHAGATLPVAGVIAMSAPYQTPNSLVTPLRPIIPLLSTIWRYARKTGSDLNDETARRHHVDYQAHPLRAVAELEDLVSSTRERLSSIKSPVLLVQSEGDTTVPVEHTRRLQAEIGEGQARILWLRESGHVVTCDMEKDHVFQAAANFIGQLQEETN